MATTSALIDAAIAKAPFSLVAATAFPKVVVCIIVADGAECA